MEVEWAFMDQNNNIKQALGTYTTIVQAEVLAIYKCAEINLKKRLNGTNINIISDSQAALKALCSSTVKSKLVWQCQESLRELSSKNKVHLWWTPGHEGVEGNEKADLLEEQEPQ